MTRFRPCIDLHSGRVKQIVGSTLTDGNGTVKENFVSDKLASWFAEQYGKDGLSGGHVIMLGKGNEAAATEALAAYPRGLQIGGGINLENAAAWLNRGASHVIVTSFVFDAEGHFQKSNLDALVNEVGAERIVLDLSCKAVDGGWRVAMNRWQTLTDLAVTSEALDELAASCAEFLVHAVDVEGKCEGIDHHLARFLGQWGKRPLTYAGGISSLSDLWTIEQLSGGNMDATIGSALDMFGGNKVSYTDCVKFNQCDSAKDQLRLVMRSFLRDIPSTEVAVKSQRMLAALMRDERWVPQTGAVALFGGLPGEPDILDLLPWLSQRGVPVVFMGFQNGELLPRVVQSEDQLVRGPFGVLMPHEGCTLVAHEDISVVLTPGLAFSRHDGMRLGRGKGHYDRFFERVPNAHRIGLGWEAQMLDSVPVEAHDQRLNALVSDAGWLFRQ